MSFGTPYRLMMINPTGQRRAIQDYTLADGTPFQAFQARFNEVWGGDGVSRETVRFMNGLDLDGSITDGPAGTKIYIRGAAADADNVKVFHIADSDAVDTFWVEESGNVYIKGDLQVTGSQTFIGGTVFEGPTIDLGNDVADTISFVGVVDTSIIPSAVATHNLGSAAAEWAGLYLGDGEFSLYVGNDQDARMGWNNSSNLFKVTTLGYATGVLVSGGLDFTTGAMSGDASVGAGNIFITAGSSTSSNVASAGGSVTIGSGNSTNGTPGTLTFNSYNDTDFKDGGVAVWRINSSADTFDFRLVPEWQLVLPSHTPASGGVEGGIMVNSSDKKLYYHNGTAWVDVAASGSGGTLGEAYTAGDRTIALVLSDVVWVTDNTNQFAWRIQTATGGLDYVDIGSNGTADQIAYAAVVQTYTVDTAAGISLGASAASDFTVDAANLVLATTTSGAVDINSVGAVTVDAAAASNFTVAGANLTLETTTAGDLNLTCAAYILSSAVSGVEIKTTNSATTTKSGYIDLFTGSHTAGAHAQDTGYAFIGTGPVSGTATGGTGDAGIYSGNAGATATRASGTVDLQTGGNQGIDANAFTGNIDLITGQQSGASGTAGSGSITVRTGNAVNGTRNSGNIELYIGSATGVSGSIKFTNNGATVASIDMENSRFDFRPGADTSWLFMLPDTNTGVVSGIAGAVAFDVSLDVLRYRDSVGWKTVAVGGPATIESVYLEDNTADITNAAGPFQLTLTDTGAEFEVTDGGTGSFSLIRAASMALVATLTAASSITVNSATFGITVDSNNLSLATTTSGEIDLTSAGLIDINAAANLDIDVTGTFDMLSTGAFSIDGTGSSNVTATAGALVLSTVTSGTLTLTSAALLDVNAAANMDVDITGTLDILATSTFSIDGTGASNVTAALGNLTLSTTTSGDLVLIGAAAIDADAPTVTIDATTNGVSIDGVTASNFSTSNGTITVAAGGTGADLVMSAADRVDIDGITLDADFTGAFAIDSAGGTPSHIYTTGSTFGIGTLTSGTFVLVAAGLMDMDAGANLDIDVTGTYDLLATSTFIIRGTGSSRVQTTAGTLFLNTATSGNVEITAASAIPITSGAASDITLITSTSTSADSGLIRLATGDTATSGTSGDIKFSVGTGVTAQGIISFDADNISKAAFDFENKQFDFRKDNTWVLVLPQSEGAVTAVRGAVRVGDTENPEWYNGSAWVEIGVGVVSLQDAYEASPSITTSTAEGDLVINLGQTGNAFQITDGTSLFQISKTASLSLDALLHAPSQIRTQETTLNLQTVLTGTLSVNAGSLLDLDGGAGFNLDGTGAACTITATTQPLTISTVTTGQLTISSAALLDVNAGSGMDIDVTGAFDMLSTGAFSIDGTGASNVSTSTGNLTLAAGGANNLILNAGGDIVLTPANALHLDDGKLIELGTSDDFNMKWDGTLNLLVLTDVTNASTGYRAGGWEIEAYTSSEAISAGNAVVLISSTGLKVAKASRTLHAGEFVGVALNTVVGAGVTVYVIVGGSGVAATEAETWASYLGDPVYLSATAGQLTVTPPDPETDTGYISRVGFVTAEGKMKIRPHTPVEIL